MSEISPMWKSFAALPRSINGHCHEPFARSAERRPAVISDILRLSEVKRVLSQEGGTITEAAMRFGFRELGRFGVLYRNAVGERPSQTRQGARLVPVLPDLHHDVPHPINEREESAP